MDPTLLQILNSLRYHSLLSPGKGMAEVLGGVGDRMVLRENGGGGEILS